MTDTVRPRLVSLDVLRGLTVVGMILVNSMAGMKYGAKAEVFPLLLHAHWEGLTIADTVFPGFLMMMGAAIPLAMAGSGAKPSGAILARTGRLVLLGFLLSNLYWFADFSNGDWRLFGVLQRIGLVYGACALLFLACGPRVRLGIIAAILVLYWPLSLLPALDGLPTDIWARGHNFVGSVDRVLLGTHLYVQGPDGYDPEGLLGTLPAIAHGLIGVAIGEVLLKRPAGAARTLALAGAGMLVLGIAWGFVFPVIKDIWSSPFVLVTCGITTLALAALHAWLDRDRTPAGATRAFVLFGTAFGINAIAAYVLHELSATMVGWQAMLLPFEALRGSLGDGLASFAPVLIYIAIIWACMDYLRRRKWIVRI
ncbi:heparan-alpha-glucosaminide N-acetyltransferase domain-containing protein [Sphingomonas sp. LB-2]|uniref:acyltransferase family protein n=1 Tax=Sphingomonas caeni TaxID=2984949 RepID=UPI00223105A2|nr:heparan-alpha-glucosaminide N-acetyltransferase domain-containing protein [Sphingomonas caeni]MCW3848031.1 heparan-alpha-glucosaminide N-acetyltransferase domain-containing protein [Sphingomonas caeni]